MNHHRAPAAVGRTHQIERESPDRDTVQRSCPACLAPVKRNLTAALGCSRLGCYHGMGLAGEEFERDVKAVEIVGHEGGLQNAANLIVVASGFEFFPGAADGKVVDDDLALLEGALGNATQLTQLKIAEALHADPDANSKYGEHQAERTAGRP